MLAEGRSRAWDGEPLSLGFAVRDIPFFVFGVEYALCLVGVDQCDIITIEVEKALRRAVLSLRTRDSARVDRPLER